MRLVLLVCVIGIVASQDAPAGFDPAYPEENPGLFEGDIELEPGEVHPHHRNAIRGTSHLWPHGTVPYTISSAHSSASHVKLFHDAMQEIMDKTMVNGKKCINFVARKSESTYINFATGSGCHTRVGYYANHPTDVTLGNGCLRKGTVMHEILHSLGFHHEQSRTDRDNYVTIHFDNIQSGRESNFKKYSSAQVDLLNMPYDYGSVLHYSAYAFAKDRHKMTIEPKQAGVTIGQRVRLSDLDAKKVQILYGCVPRPSSPGQTPAPSSNPITNQPPSVTHVTHGTLVNAATLCTFDSGLCHWHQSVEDNVDWIVGHGSTPSRNTGPHADHTGSTSAHYLFMEASGHPDQKAILESQTFSAGYYCFNAYYNLNGHLMGTVNFIIKEDNGRKFTFKSVRGDHHDRWYHTRVGLNIHSHNFQILIEGITGHGYTSDMAIDDISVSPGHC